MPVDVVCEILVPRSRPVVAAFACDPDNVPAWYANIRTVEWQTPRPVALGTRLAFVAQFLGRRLAYVYEVVDLVPGERLVMRTADGPFPMETTYTFTDVDGGTLVRLRNRGEPAGFARVAAPVMAGAVRRANVEDLRRLVAGAHRPEQRVPERQRQRRHRRVRVGRQAQLAGQPAGEVVAVADAVGRAVDAEHRASRHGREAVAAQPHQRGLRRQAGHQDLEGGREVGRPRAEHRRPPALDELGRQRPLDPGPAADGLAPGVAAPVREPRPHGQHDGVQRPQVEREHPAERLLDGDQLGLGQAGRHLGDLGQSGGGGVQVPHGVLTLRVTACRCSSSSSGG